MNVWFLLNDDVLNEAYEKFQESFDEIPDIEEISHEVVLFIREEYIEYIASMSAIQNQDFSLFQDAITGKKFFSETNEIDWLQMFVDVYERYLELDFCVIERNKIINAPARKVW